MVRRSVDNPFKWPEIINNFGVNPKLVKEVKLGVYEELTWRYEKRHW
jgi:hypothetical protein